MPDIYIIANQHRRALLARDEAARRRMVEAYKPVRKRLIDLLAQVNTAINERRAQGETVSPMWLFQQQRYRALIEQTQTEINRWAMDFAQPTIAFEQQQAVSLAGTHAANLIAAGQPVSVGAVFNRLPVSALENLVGFTGDGSPLSALLSRYGAVSAGLVKNALVNGLASGKGIAVTAREIAGIIDQPRWHAERIARTELLRSYREASRQNYEANGITRWEWLCSRSRRTCAACLFLDGQIFEVSKPMPAHVSCRCTAIPVLGNTRKRQTGAEWFALQSEDAQINTLGKAGAEAYRSSKATLGDFVTLKTSEKWGDSYVQTGL